MWSLVMPNVLGCRIDCGNGSHFPNLLRSFHHKPMICAKRCLTGWGSRNNSFPYPIVQASDWCLYVNCPLVVGLGANALTSAPSGISSLNRFFSTIWMIILWLSLQIVYGFLS